MADRLLFPFANAIKKVSAPTLPINILNIIIIFPTDYSSGVSPVDSPTVP